MDILATARDVLVVEEEIANLTTYGARHAYLKDSLAVAALVLVQLHAYSAHALGLRCCDLEGGR